MTTVGELIPDAPNVILWGEVGTGKTALALTLGKGALVHCFDPGGLITGLTLKDKWTADRHAVEAKLFIEKRPDIEATIFSNYKKYVMDLVNSIHKGQTHYTAIIIDSLTTLALAASNQVMRNSGMLNRAPELQHWNAIFAEIKNVLSWLRATPVPLVLIAHEMIKTYGKGKDATEKLQIAIQGKNLPAEITRFFDEIWYLYTRPVGQGQHRRMIQTIADDKLLGRSRSQVPTDTDTSCGMWALFELMGYKKEFAMKT